MDPVNKELAVYEPVLRHFPDDERKRFVTEELMPVASDIVKAREELARLEQVATFATLAGPSADVVATAFRLTAVNAKKSLLELEAVANTLMLEETERLGFLDTKTPRGFSAKILFATIVGMNSAEQGEAQREADALREHIRLRCASGGSS